jgi:hypothetical protein
VNNDAVSRHVLTPNARTHRPPPATGTRRESSVQETQSIGTEALGGGSCAADLLAAWFKLKVNL